MGRVALFLNMKFHAAVCKHHSLRLLVVIFQSLILTGVEPGVDDYKSVGGGGSFPTWTCSVINLLAALLHVVNNSACFGHLLNAYLSEKCWTIFIF